MKQSTCGAVICQPGGDELKHDIMNILGKEVRHTLVQQHVGMQPMIVESRHSICE